MLDKISLEFLKGPLHLADDEVFDVSIQIMPAVFFSQATKTLLPGKHLGNADREGMIFRHERRDLFSQIPQHTVWSRFFSLTNPNNRPVEAQHVSLSPTHSPFTPQPVRLRRLASHFP